VNASPLWLCLRFPQLPLDIVQRASQHQTDSAQAIALIDKQRVVLANSLAAAAGISPGMTLTSAYALVPDLNVTEHQAERESNALQFLADWSYQFTPAVSLLPPGALLLEIAGSLRLFHGLQPLLRQIDKGLRQMGFHYQPALAHTPLAAEVFSRDSAPLDICQVDLSTVNTEHFLQQLQQTPLTQLILDGKAKRQEKVQHQLHQLGLTTIGQLLALPPGELGQRFGSQFITTLTRLTGEAADLRPTISPRAHFESELHFLSGLSTVAMLEQPVRQLLQEFQQFLQQRQLHCRSFRWRFFHFDKQASLLPIELSRGQNNPANFLTLTLLKMEQLTLASAVETVQLRADQLQTASVDNRNLFRELSGPDNQDPWFLLDKLRSRLGSDAIFCLHPQDENLPELQQQKTAPDTGLTTTVKRAVLSRAVPFATESPAAETNTPPRPLWLYEPPQPLRRRKKKLYFQGPLELIDGPQRIDSHWWQQRQQRDYFIARHHNGAHYWVYFDHNSKHWFVHGVFA